MKAIVVTDQAAGTAGMTLAERPEPEVAGNDVLVEVHASGFTPGELSWPSNWTDRLGRDRTPSIPGHELAGVVSDSAMARRGRRWDSGCSASRTGLATAPWRSTRPWRRVISPRCRATSTSRWAEPADLGSDRVARTVRAWSPSGGAERPRARCGRRRRLDGDPARA
jgi:hypothetical protein